MGEKNFQKVQYGKETTHGTTAAATNRWNGFISVPADRKPVFPEESIGIRARANRSQINQILADGIVLSAKEGIFQKLPFLFTAGLKGGVTGGTANSGAYTWAFTPSLSALNNPDSYSIEYGDDTQAYVIEYALCKRIRISGRIGANEAVNVEGEFFGKQITPQAFTASLNLLAADAEPMIANLTKLYIDTAWAGVGGTQVTGLLREYSVEILTGVHPKFQAGGTKTMTNDAESYIDVMATFTLEGVAAADTQFDLFQAGTTRAIRLLIEGSVIGAAIKHSLQLDMFGTWEEIIPLGSEQDGNDLHTAVFHCHSDGLATPNMLGIVVTTNKVAV